MELLKDYDLQIQYHLEKENVGVDALSRKTQHGLNTMISTQPDIRRELENMGIELVSSGFTDGLLSVLEV